MNANIQTLIFLAEAFILTALLGIAAYRITRFFLFDTIIESIRQKWYMWLINRKHFKRTAQKALELTSCTWCFGVHISWLLYAGWTRLYPWQFGVKGWIIVAAIAGVQGFTHALEPGDE